MNRSSKHAERVKIRDFDSSQDVNHGQEDAINHATALKLPVDACADV
jgi:hypothetical protein